MILEKGEETLTVEIVIIIVKEIISQVDTIEDIRVLKNQKKFVIKIIAIEKIVTATKTDTKILKGHDALLQQTNTIVIVVKQQSVPQKEIKLKNCILTSKNVNKLQTLLSINKATN